MEADALLRPVGGELEAVTPFAREVELAAGAEVVERLHRMEELPVGAAAVTPGGDLSTPFLIHAVVQTRDDPPSVSTVSRALRNGLRRAAEWDLEAVALPPLGTGAGALQPEEAATTMLDAVAEFAQEFGRAPELIFLVGSDYEEDVFRRAIQRHGGAQA